MLINIWWSFLAYFFPDKSVEEDVAIHRQARLAISFCYIAPMFLYINALKWNSLGAGHIAVVETGLATLMILMTFAYKTKIAPLNFVCNFIILSLLITFFYLSFFTGGLDSTQIFWVILIPLFAQLLLPGRWGHFWFVTTSLVLLGLFILETMNYQFPISIKLNDRNLFTQWVTAIVGCLTASYIASTMFKAGILTSVTEMEDSKEKAESVSQNLNQVLEQIRTSSDDLNTSSSELLQTSKKLEEDTSLYFDKTSSIFDSSQSIRRKMDTVAAEIKLATDRMEDISNTAVKARKIAEEGNSIAKETSESMVALKKGGEDSVNITNMIQQTSKQLKLLSLNAAIEAANAGEHGQGFAIVANQVKKLAEKTSEATAEVTEINQNIQITTDRSAEYISRIVEIIQDFYELQQSISSSVEKQNSATKVISRGLSETADVASLIASSTNEVVSATERTREEVKKNFSEATGLAAMSDSLNRLIKTDKA